MLKNEQQNNKKILDEEDDEIDDEEEEEEEMTEWTLNDEKDFLRTLGALKSHDPEIYQTNVKFFKEKKEEENNKSKEPSIPKLKQQKMTLKEYEQKLILERGGKLSEDEEEEMDYDNDDEEKEEKNNLKNEKVYLVNKNDLELKNEFKNALSSDDEIDNDDLLVKRIKTEEEKAKEDEDFYEWIKGENQMKVDDKHLRKLKERWTKNVKDLAEDELFLRDFLLNKKYLGDSKDDEEKEERIPTYEEIIKEEQEEDLADQFEQKYNFRFEEPDQEFLKQYPRTINEALRKKESKRHKKLIEEKEAKKLKRTHVEMVEMPFRYRQVVPNSFGLSTDEILTSDDRSLNAWAPLSKICQYRDDTEEQKQLLYFERKSKNVEKKLKILEKRIKSDEKLEEKEEADQMKEESNNEDEEEEEQPQNIQSTSCKIRREFKEQKEERQENELNKKEKIINKEEQQQIHQKNKKKKKKLGKNKNKGEFKVTELDKERIKAYGIGTIKKLKNIQFCKKMEEKMMKKEENNNEIIKNERRKRKRKKKEGKEN